MNVLQNIYTLSDAEAALKERGVFVDTVYQDIIDAGRHWGIPRENHGVHIYFNQGRSNWAYFTPAMNTLAIFDTPRADAMCGEKNFIRRPAPPLAPTLAAH
jgi:hypothetical protein